MKDFSPLTLEGRDVRQFRYRDRDRIIQRGVRAQEVVMSNEKGSSRDSAIEIIEGMSRFDMGFISSVKSFNNLFKMSEMSGYGIEVLKTSNRDMRDRVERSGKIKEIDGFKISRVFVSDSSDFLGRRSSSDSFIDRGSSREDTFGMMDMIRKNSSGFGREKEKGIEFFCKDFDIRFIAENKIVNFIFKSKIKLMAEESRDLDIIKDGLIRDRDLKNFSEDKSSFSCRDTEGDIEGKSKGKSVKRVSNICEIKRRFIGMRNTKLMV